MRDASEWPEAIEAGAARLRGRDADGIIAEVEVLLDAAVRYAAMAGASNPFGDGKTGRRIVEVLEREVGETLLVEHGCTRCAS